MTLTTGTAIGHCCGGHARKGSPVRNLIGDVVQRVQDRRAARGGQLVTTANPTPPAVTRLSRAVMYGADCPNKRCPRQ